MPRRSVTNTYSTSKLSMAGSRLGTSALPQAHLAALAVCLFKAADRKIAGNTPQRIAGIRICSLNPNDVAAAIKRSTPKGLAAIDDTASYTIVARCGTSDRVFALPFPEEVDFKILKRISPQATSLLGPWPSSFRARIRKELFIS